MTVDLDWPTVCLIIAMVLFLIAAVVRWQARFAKVNLTALGLAFLTLAFVVA